MTNKQKQWYGFTGLVAVLSGFIGNMLFKSDQGQILSATAMIIGFIALSGPLVGNGETAKNQNPDINRQLAYEYAFYGIVGMGGGLIGLINMHMAEEMYLAGAIFITGLLAIMRAIIELSKIKPSLTNQ